MRKVVALCALGVALVLAGCANQNGTEDYNADGGARYSSTRTADGDAVTTTRGDTTFSRRQVK